MISILLLLLYLSIAGPPLLLIACAPKKKKDESAAALTPAEMSKPTSGPGNGQKPPPEVPDKIGDKPVGPDGSKYDSLAVTDKLGKGKSMKGKSTVEQTAKEADGKSKAAQIDKEEKPAEKDKTDEKTKYGDTQYMSVVDKTDRDKDNTHVGGKTRKGTVTKEITKDDKKMEKKEEKPAADKTAAPAAAAAAEQPNAKFTESVVVNNEAKAFGSKEKKSKKETKTSKKEVKEKKEEEKGKDKEGEKKEEGKEKKGEKKEEGKEKEGEKKEEEKEKEEEKVDQSQLLDQSQMATMMDKPKDVETGNLDVDEALAPTPPPESKMGQVKRSDRSKKGQANDTQGTEQSADMKKKKTIGGIHGTQVTERSTFLNPKP